MAEGSALGEKRETEARCILPDTIFLYLLEMFKQMAVPGVENLETLHVPWNERSRWKLTALFRKQIRLAGPGACQGPIQANPG